MLLYVHRRLIRDWGEGWRRRESKWLDRALRPGKTEEAVDHRQNNYVKTVGTSPLRSN